MGNFEGEKAPAQDRASMMQMPIGVYWTWVHIGTTWQIWLNCPCAVTMRSYVKLLWPLVIMFVGPRSWERLQRLATLLWLVAAHGNKVLRQVKEHKEAVLDLIDMYLSGR